MVKRALIAVEGIDGAGKTTIVKFLVEELRRRGYNVVALKEPTESEWGKKIRQAFRDRSLKPEEELDLFLKDREWNVKHNILPALKAGKIVIMDRYYYSTIAYQGARGIEPNYIRKLNERFPKPNLVIILDIKPETALERIRMRGDKPNRFEDLEYLKRVRNIFLSLKDNVVVVNAERDINEVKRDVLSIVLRHISKGLHR